MDKGIAMPVFEYKAVDMDTSPLAGTIVADTPRSARDVLRDRGLTITALRSVAERGTSPFRSARAKRCQGEIIAFIRELGTLLGAGIRLLDALRTLSEQHSRRVRTAIQTLADEVAAGNSLADAMARQRLYFDDVAVSIVTVGESTGSLETALTRLADFKEKAHSLRSRVITALLYPAVVLVIGLSVMIFLMTYVVPMLVGALEQANRDLPALTQFIKDISDLLIDWWWALLAGLGGGVLALRAAIATDRGKRLWHRAMLRIPVIGEMIRKENTSRIAVVLSALLRSGLPFIEAIQITRRTVRNRAFQEALADYEQAVGSGKDVAGPLKESGVFRPMVIQMLAVGQESGELEDMLDQLSRSYDQQVATATTRLTSIIEPLLIVLLAVMVGFIAFATILPILEISNVV